MNTTFRLCRFRGRDEETHVGLMAERSAILDLTAAGIRQISSLLEERHPAARLQKLARTALPRIPLARTTLLSPIERQEVWAAGVTYLRSKKARMEESDFSASAYDLVYEATRPELFFKSLPEKVVGPGDAVGIRKDARWSVPEPELVLVINSRGVVAGYSIGNDMSSRDIEGANLLYLPQAKVHDRSCAVGPWIVIGPSERDARSWDIRLDIRRGGRRVFRGETSVGQLKRSFAELSAFLYRSQTFACGACLLTGTGIVPPDNFTLKPNDRIRIEITGIGILDNRVVPC